MTMGKLKNVKKAMKVLKCVRCSEDVDGLNAVSILFQTPCRRFTEDLDAPEIIKTDLTEGDMVGIYPTCGFYVVWTIDPG